MERLVQSIPELKGEDITLNSWFSKKNAKKKCNGNVKRCLKDIVTQLKYIFIHIFKV